MEGYGMNKECNMKNIECKGRGTETIKYSGLKRFFFRFKYFLLWFIGFFGFFSMNAHCPGCGQAVAPYGVGVLAIVSGVLAFFMQFGRVSLAYIKKIFLKIF